MTNKNDNGGSHDSLLTEEQFTALIEAEYISNGRPVDNLAKQKIWNTLHSQIDHVESNRIPSAKQWSQRIASVFSLSAAAVMVLALIPMLSSYHMNIRERNKGTGDFPIVNISAFVVNNVGELSMVNEPKPAGTTIVFKVDMPNANAIALVISKDSKPPQVKYRTHIIQPGIGQLLQVEGQIYGYQLEFGDKSLTFCAIAAENELKLSQRLRLLSKFWESLPSASCVQLDVT